jgi:hypothetical protein
MSSRCDPCVVQIYKLTGMVQGLLYRLSTKQALLPSDLNPDVLMEPAVLAGQPVGIPQWNKQVLNWQRSNPVVVFSKVSRCLHRWSPEY